MAGLYRMSIKTPPSPPRAGEAQRKPPSGWTQPVWDLRQALLAASTRLPRGSGLQRLLEGAERWVKLTGKGRPGPGLPASPESAQWWRDTMALVEAVAACGDHGTRLLLAPWLGGRGTPSGGFTPFGG